ncbi:MAG: DNA repair exonuclease [Lachnospiraceae bacterium]|nr:DNA repair exonuclease [Lachnospiraceae bacterium]
MKLIHTADLHLDSRLTGNLDREKAKIRKTEILHTFTRITDYAAENGVSGVLIAGDLFDTASVSATARNVVLAGIAGHPEITFFWLRGNHDRDNFLSGLEEVPPNLKQFRDRWTSYRFGPVTVTGAELNRENAGALFQSLFLEYPDINIVMLHGQEMKSRLKDKTEVIELPSLKNRNIDYLALGHIHSYKAEKLDSRGVYCYPGCPDGRGFDECGEKGFVLLHVDEETKQVRPEFVPFSSRTLYTVEADVTGCANTPEIEQAVRAKLGQAYPASSLLKVLLTGRVPVECEKDVLYLETVLGRQYFHVRVEDCTELSVNYEDYLYDRSLRGEFVRLVMADGTLSGEEKGAVIRTGFRALSGEEI